MSPWDNNFNILGIGYRSDWATRLGIKDPETIADWYAMLKAFHTKDPNGNGRIDVIPLLAQHDDGLTLLPRRTACRPGTTGGA